MNGHERVRPITNRHNRGQKIDGVAHVLEQRLGAFGNLEVDLPLLFPAARGASLQPSKLWWQVVELPVTDLQADALLARWVVERGRRQRRAEGAESARLRSPLAKRRRDLVGIAAVHGVTV